jgi:hypothetical protein
VLATIVKPDKAAPCLIAPDFDCRRGRHDLHLFHHQSVGNGFNRGVPLYCEKVLQAATSPESRPRRNHSERSVEVP